MCDNIRQVDGEALEQAIHAAFDQAPIPAMADLCPFNNRGDPDVIAIRRRVGGKTWPVLLQELLDMDGTERNFFHSVYYLLTPYAFHYYLPAFMIVSLDPVRADLTGESLFYALTPSDVRGDHQDKWFTAFAVLVTLVQREAIRSLILHVYDLCQKLQIGDITDDELLRRFWFPEGFPRLTPDDDALRGL